MWLFIAITVFSVFNNLNTETSAQELSYSEFISQVESDQVLSVEFASDNYTLKGKTVNGESFETYFPRPSEGGGFPSGSYKTFKYKNWSRSCK